MPRSLDLDRLKQFETPREVPQVELQSSHSVERWPSREPVRDGQISIKAPLDVIERFRQTLQGRPSDLCRHAFNFHGCLRA